MPNTKSKKSNGQKKASGGVNIRRATSSLLAPVTVRNQRGMGSIDLIAPVSLASQQRTRGPRMRSQSDGKMIVIKKRELVASINGSVAFSAQKFAVNPGLSATFPWLSTQAANWEQYRFRRLSFEYITRTATTTVGSVIMAPDYDPEDPVPLTEAQLTAYEDAVEDAPWKNILCVIRTDNVTPGPRKFVRSGSEAGDIKNYDALNLFLGTTEFAGASPIGKLWVDYEVELFVPQVIASSSAPAPRAQSIFRAAASQSFTTAVNESLTFDAASPGDDPLGIGNSVNSGAGGVFTPPRGAYRLDYMASFNDTVVETFTVIVDIFKNGVINGARSIIISADGGIDQTSGHDIVRCSGTDTVEVMVNATGAAGAISTSSNSVCLIWSLA